MKEAVVLVDILASHLELNESSLVIDRISCLFIGPRHLCILDPDWLGLHTRPLRLKHQILPRVDLDTFIASAGRL